MAAALKATALRAPYASVRVGSRKGIQRPTVTVGISEPLSNATAWEIEATAHVGDGQIMVARVRVPARIAGQRASRAVLMCCCPGALAWDIKATSLDVAGKPSGWLTVDWGHDLGALLAVPFNGALLLAGGPDAGAYNHDAGTAAGAVSIPAGARVRGWSLQATGGGAATLTITSPVFGVLGAVTVPLSSAFGDTPDGLVGPATFTFAGFVASRWVSWLQLR